MKPFTFISLLYILFAWQVTAAPFEPPSGALAKSELADAFLKNVRMGMRQNEVHAALRGQEEAITHSKIHCIFSFYGWEPLQLIHDGDSYSFWMMPPQSPLLPKNVSPITIFGTVKFDNLPHTRNISDILEKSALSEFFLGRRKGTLLEYTVSYPIANSSQPGKFSHMYFYDGPDMQNKPIGSGKTVYLNEN